MRDDNDTPIEYDEDELRLFAQLPREAAVNRHDVERLLPQLRAEGLLGRPAPRWRWQAGAAAAAAAILIALGFAAGRASARRDSLEDLLARRDLTVAERVLVLQRAGSAYVLAAQRYADATATVDSSAVEVASRVLIGAAHAVARQGLDAGLAARLMSAFEPAAPRAATHSVIWF